ncbi:MAG: HTH domain-containing protein [Thermoplasmata archaeon]|nr:MAG: HTH domain-containing protein [Thermoplasmata archaeon]
MIEIKSGTMEEKIIKILQKKYPITIEQIRSELKVSRAIIERELRKLQARGILLLEPLPDKTFIRLLRNDFRFIGRRHQYKFIKKKIGKREIKEEDEDDIMFR